MEAAVANFKDSWLACLVETTDKAHTEVPPPVIVNAVDFDFNIDLCTSKLSRKAAEDSDLKLLTCSDFCGKGKSESKTFSAEVNQ